jgi:hypothetical protein
MLPTELRRELDGGGWVLRTPEVTIRLGKKLAGHVAIEGVGMTLDVS